MKEYKFKDLTGESNENQGANVFEKTVYISLSKNGEDKNFNRDKGVDTIMFEAENGVTIILEKDCKTDKILGIEIFE